MGSFHERELPGEDLVLKGLADHQAGIESIESILVQIGAPRLRACGLQIPARTYPEFAEERLYHALQKIHGDEAHAQMNALIRRLVSFEHALEIVCLQKNKP